MSTYLGDFEVGKTVYIHFTTHAADDSLVNPSAAFTASDFRIYKNDSVTQRTSTAGITVASPFDSVVGRHLIAIDTSNNGHAGFYAAGNDYRVEVDSAKTIDGVNQSGVVVGTFSIQNRYAPAALDAAGIRAALGLSAANLDSQLTGISSKTTNLPASPAAVGSEMTLANNAITAAKIATSALNGKGDWNVGKTGYSLASSAITASTIAAGALNGKGDWNIGKTGYSLASGSITASTIAANAIGATQLATDAIGATQIASGAITAAKIAASALNGKGDWNIGKTGYSLAEAFPSDYATATQLATAKSDLEDLLEAIDAKTVNLPASPAAVGSEMTLADGAITAAKIAANAIGATQLANNAIGASQIAGNAITSAKIAANAIGASQLAAGAIAAAKIADGALNGKGDWNVGKTGYSLADGSIVANTIAAGALDDKGNWNVGKTGYSLTDGFPSDYATAAQLTATQEDLEDLLAAIDAKTTNLPATPAAAGDAMTLADGAITSAKIAAGAIGATQLASGAITSAKIASNAIGASQIASNAIAAAKIAAGALNGKGDWNVGKTGYSLAEPFPSDYAKPADVAQAASDVIAALPVAPDNATIETIWEKLDLLAVDGSGRVTTANPATEGGDVIVEPTVLDVDSITAVAAAVKLQLSALEDDAAAAKVAAELAVTRLPTTLVSGQMAAHVSGLDDALATLTDQILIIAQNVHT